MKQKGTEVLPWILWCPWILAAPCQITGCSKKVDENQEVGAHSVEVGTAFSLWLEPSDSHIL